MAKIRRNLHSYFYLILLGVTLIQLCFIPEIRLGFVTSIIILFLALNEISFKIILANSKTNLLVLGYILYNSASSLLYIFNGIPFSVFAAEWSNSILPVLFYYFAQRNLGGIDNFYKITLYSIILNFTIGFASWMLDLESYRIFMDATEGLGTDLVHFQSLFGLTATGVFSVIGFLISASLVFKSNGKTGKIYVIFFATSAFLTFRRGSIFALLVLFLALQYFAYFKFKFLSKRYMLLQVISLCAAYLFVAQQYGDFLGNLIERLTTSDVALAERNSAWHLAVDYDYLIVGRGLGSVGHKAIGFSEILFADGNYLKLFAETGVVGFLLFALIIISATINGCEQLKEKYLELGIVFTVCSVSLGSNILTYQSIAPIFWYSIGKLSIELSRPTRGLAGTVGPERGRPRGE